jgi:exopolysaccharide production protein ExoQ
MNLLLQLPLRTLRKIQTEQIFCIFLYTLIPVTLLAPKGIVPLFIVMFLSTIFVQWRSRTKIPLPSKSILLMLALPHLWGLISCIWSVEPLKGLTQLLKIIGINGAGLIFLQIISCLQKDKRKLICTHLVHSFFILLILHHGITLDFITIQKNSTFYNKSITLMCFLFWPIWILVTEKHQSFFVRLLTFFLALFTFLKADFDAVGLAYVSSLFCFMIAFILKKKFIRFAALTIPLFTLATPWIFSHIVTPETVAIKAGIDRESWNHRMLIYRFTSEQIFKSPILGYGLNTSSSKKFKHKKALTILSYNTFHMRKLDVMPLHPHNVFLQWWLELGFIGALLISFLFFTALWKFRASKNHSYAMMAAFSVSVGIISLVGFGAWQSWFLTTFWISLVCFNIALNETEDL